jgi:hypothetical protein
MPVAVRPRRHPRESVSRERWRGRAARGCAFPSEKGASARTTGRGSGRQGPIRPRTTSATRRSTRATRYAATANGSCTASPGRKVGSRTVPSGRLPRCSKVSTCSCTMNAVGASKAYGRGDTRPPSDSGHAPAMFATSASRTIAIAAAVSPDVRPAAGPAASKSSPCEPVGDPMIAFTSACASSTPTSEIGSVTSQARLRRIVRA